MMQAASEAVSDGAPYARDVATADAVTPLVATKDADNRSSWHGKPTSNLGLLSILLLSLGFLATAFLSFTSKDPAQASQCEMAWMSPSYLRLNNFNETHSRLASKYSLWFYREQGYDLSNKPHGVPVLFAPGNAGSYRQVRSLAAEAARSFYEKPGVPRPSLADAGHLELDWFAADFNEDFSAFHAATLREQAEYLTDAIRYILSLYGTGDASRPMPISVILVAHSMGGIASRLALLQPGFAPGSVKTILTLSTPHSMPPASFDAGIEKVYSDINGFWGRSYAQASASLEDVLLVSMAGGTADTTVSSDYSGISGFTPPSNGFAVLTSSIPSLFSPVDHLAMVWCDQLRKSVAGALLRTTSATSPDRARPLAERLQVMREYLLTGLEAPPPIGSLSSSSPPLASSSYAGHVAISGPHAAQTIEIRKPQDSPSSKLTIWTSIDTEDDRGGIAVHLCNGGDDKQECKTLEKPVFRRIPLNMASTKDGTALPLYHANSLYFERPLGQQYASVVLEIPAMEDGFLVASLAEQADGEIATSLLRLAMFGSTTQVPVGALASVLRYSALDTSLLAYRVTAQPDCQSAIPPLLRVHATELHESLFFPDPKAPLVYLHSSPPFLPSTFESAGLALQLWRDPSCSAEVHIGLDWYASVGKLVLRYRSLVAAWPVAIVLPILQIQLQEGSTFDKAFRPFVTQQLPIISLAGVGVAALQSLASTLGLFQYWPVYTALLGNRHFLFLPLAPLFLVTVSGVTYACHLVVYTVLGLLSTVWSATVISGPRRFTRNPTFTNLREQWLKTRIATFACLALLILVFAPHQFAFLVLLLVQFDTTLRARVIARQSKDQTARDRFDRNYTLLFLMLLLLPQNGAILLVWSRNLLAGWYAPFPSDHNVLAILGYLLLVEHGQTGKILRHGKLSSLIIYPCAAGVLLYGARYAFIASIAVNLVFLALYVQWGAATSP